MSHLTLDQHKAFLKEAVAEAEAGVATGGIPIGCVIVHHTKDGKDEIIGRGHNQRVQLGSAIRHGEMDALEKTGRRTAATYSECTLYTTLSPCSMCTGAILLYKIPRVVIGENATFMGEEELLRSRGVSIIQMDDQRCKDLMAAFIEGSPALWNEDIGV